MDKKEFKVIREAAMDAVLADMTANGIDLAELVAYSCLKLGKDIEADTQSEPGSAKELALGYFHANFVDNVEVILNEM